MPYPNRKHLMQLLTCLLVLCYCNTSFAVEVSFWSLESLSSDKKGGFAEIWVRCAGDDTKFFLRKRSGSRQWCTQATPSLCSTDKREASRMVCADDSPFQLAKRTNKQGQPQVDQNNVQEPPRQGAAQVKLPQQVDREVVKTGYEGMAIAELNSEQNALQQEQAELESKLRQLNSRKQALKRQLEGI